MRQPQQAHSLAVPPEHLTMDGGHRLEVRDIRDEDPSPDHVRDRRARFFQRGLDSRKSLTRLCDDVVAANGSLTRPCGHPTNKHKRPLADGPRVAPEALEVRPRRDILPSHRLHVDPFGRSRAIRPGDLGGGVARHPSSAAHLGRHGLRCVKV